MLRLAAGHSELETGLAWLKDFERTHGRPLRVLHVGNIAANGYLNAKFLRRVGVEADLLICDYYHVMGCPEWEDIDLAHGHGDDNKPSFHPDDVKGYQRPDWVTHGSLIECIAQASLKIDQWPDAERTGWLRIPGVMPIKKAAKAVAVQTLGAKTIMAARLFYQEPVVVFFMGIARCAGGLATKSSRVANGLPGPIRQRLAYGVKFRVARCLKSVVKFFNSVQVWADDRAKSSASTILLEAARVALDFAHTFPDRPDKLSLTEAVMWVARARHFRKLFEEYDVVQCYAVEPIMALLCDKRPYVCFEHGTLRDFTQGDLPLHRLTALAYRKADHAFITNGDCLAYAKKLGMENYSPIIHPIDVEQHRTDYAKEAAQIRADAGADVLIFCPVRHDYKIKGTDVAIKALPIIKERLPGKRVVMMLADWGSQVDESRTMLKKLGCEENVAWCQAMCRVQMIQMIQASDCVLDQFVLPVFGSTAPQSLAAGKPVIASYDPKQTEWLIPEPAPILSATTPEEVADAVLRTQDPAWLRSWQQRARHWIDTYHHPNNAISDHLQVYRQVLSKRHRRSRPVARGHAA